jgi:hypothetical protein
MVSDIDAPGFDTIEVRLASLLSNRKIEQMQFTLRGLFAYVTVLSLAILATPLFPPLALLTGPIMGWGFGYLFYGKSTATIGAIAGFVLTWWLLIPAIH